ncbi:MAG: flagellar protein FliT [Lachnospiraceae bacterium]|nr:flagellar protein FliT [Lachnospiraceae bacterium]
MSLSSAQILVESLEKKSRILDEIIEENAAQERLFKQEELDMEALDASSDRMGELAEKLELLDEGFESVYDRIRQELIDNKSAYRVEIKRMQELIAVITEKVVTINAARMRNKLQAENHFKKSRQKIGRASSKMKVSQNYYNNMNQLNFVNPQFYDNKK